MRSPRSKTFSMFSTITSLTSLTCAQFCLPRARVRSAANPADKQMPASQSQGSQQARQCDTSLSLSLQITVFETFTHKVQAQSDRFVIHETIPNKGVFVGVLRGGSLHSLDCHKKGTMCALNMMTTFSLAANTAAGLTDIGKVH